MSAISVIALIVTRLMSIAIMWWLIPEAGGLGAGIMADPGLLTTTYWGGGFWGSFAAGAAVTGLTAAAINAANDDSPEYIVIQEGSPGNTLFSSYGLVQVQCVEGGNLVFIYGPQDSLICATPNSSVVAGYYDVNPNDMTLIVR